jgi:hypothetical protein
VRSRETIYRSVANGEVTLEIAILEVLLDIREVLTEARFQDPPLLKR